jgi:hypothetical protein
MQPKREEVNSPFASASAAEDDEHFEVLVEQSSA